MFSRIPNDGHIRAFEYSLWDAFSDSLSLSFYDTAHQVANLALKPTMDGAKVGKSPREIIRIGKLIAENICILLYLENIEDILLNAYTRGNGMAIPIQDENIFASTEKWNKFKTKLTEKLEEKSMLFLDPWLSELGRIVADIETAS